MCKQPAMRAPFNGWLGPYSALKAIKPGISASAKRISLRPQSARLRSATLFFRLKSMECCVIVDINFDCLSHKCTIVVEYSIQFVKFRIKQRESYILQEIHLICYGEDNPKRRFS